MTTGGDHVTIPKLLLWGMALSFIGGLGGGGFYVGQLSERVATLEKSGSTVDRVSSGLGAVTDRLSRIEAQLGFVIQHDFPGQQGAMFYPPPDRADK